MQEKPCGGGAEDGLVECKTPPPPILGEFMINLSCINRINIFALHKKQALKLTISAN